MDAERLIDAAPVEAALVGTALVGTAPVGTALVGTAPVEAEVDAVRRMARRARELAEEAADAAERGRSALGVAWRSTAADQFREALQTCSRQIEACAETLECAARSLGRHAWTVEARVTAARAAVKVLIP